VSIFDFLFARGATPEQRDKNIFLDMIDGGGRFDDDDEFKGGPLGISALLNALGVNPYGSTNAQPQDKPQGQAFAPRPASGPAGSLRPRQQMPDELLTERFGPQFALGTPSEITTTALPRRGNPGYAFSRGDSATPAPPPAPPMGTSFGNLGNPVDMNRDLGLLAPQVEAAIRESETNYFDAAVNYPEFFPFVQANLNSGLTTEQLARQFLKIPEGTNPPVSASPLTMSAAPAALSSSSIGSSGSLPVLSNDYPTNTIKPFSINTNSAGPQGHSMPTVPGGTPTYAAPSPHPESEIQRFMRDYDMTRAAAIQSLDASALYEREIRKGMQDAFSR